MKGDHDTADSGLIEILRPFNYMSFLKVKNLVM